MSLEEIGKEVSKFAPLIGGALGGPAGSIIGQVISRIFDGDVNNPSDLLTKINSDPSSKEKLLALQNQHEESLYYLQNLDIQDARKNNLNCKDWIIHFLAITYTVGLFLFIIIQIMFPSNNPDKEMFHDLLNPAMIILSFYFGSAYRMISDK